MLMQWQQDRSLVHGHRCEVRSKLGQQQQLPCSTSLSHPSPVDAKLNAASAVLHVPLHGPVQLIAVAEDRTGKIASPVLVGDDPTLPERLEGRCSLDRLRNSVAQCLGEATQRLPESTNLFLSSLMLLVCVCVCATCWRPSGATNCVASTTASTGPKP